MSFLAAVLQRWAFWFSASYDLLPDKHQSNITVCKQKEFLLYHIFAIHTHGFPELLRFILSSLNNLVKKTHKEVTQSAHCSFLLPAWNRKQVNTNRQASPLALVCLIHPLLHTACVCVVVATRMYPCSLMSLMTASSWVMCNHLKCNLY